MTQNFWRCAHHPSAIDNFFEKRKCAHYCHATELRWFDGGVHQNLSVVKPTDLREHGPNAAMAKPPCP